MNRTGIPGGSGAHRVMNDLAPAGDHRGDFVADLVDRVCRGSERGAAVVRGFKHTGHDPRLMQLEPDDVVLVRSLLVCER